MYALAAKVKLEPVPTVVVEKPIVTALRVADRTVGFPAISAEEDRGMEAVTLGAARIVTGSPSVCVWLPAACVLTTAEYPAILRRV